MRNALKTVYYLFSFEVIYVSITPSSVVSLGFWGTPHSHESGNYWRLTGCETQRWVTSEGVFQMGSLWIFFFFLCYALHKDICPEKRALLFFSFLKMFLFYIVDLQSFISDVKQSNSVIYTYTYTYAFSDYFPILIIMEYWVEFLVLYSRSLLIVIYKY